MKKTIPPKKAVKPSAAKKPAAAPAGNKGLSLKSILLFVVLAFSYILYIKNLYGFKDLTNPFIERKAGWILSVQPLITLMIYSVFGYFAYLFLNGKRNDKLTKIGMGAGLVMVVALHALAFNPAFEVNVDDNASYMIATQSLVDHGAPYYLYMPSPAGQPEVLRPDTEGAIGLPLMLIPLYLIWGMDFQPMEILVFFTLIAAVIACFLMFRRMTNTYLALALTVLFATHPYIVAFSSLLMTEIPFLFWCLLAVFLVIKFQTQEKLSPWYLAAAVIAVFMTYLTRAVGIGLVVAAALYALLHSNMWVYLRKKSFAFLKDTRFIRFALLSGILLVLTLGYQFWARSLGGASQADALSKMDISAQFGQNLDASWKVFAQSIFSGGIIRWKVLGVQPAGTLWTLVALITLLGLGISLLKRELAALATLFIAIVLMVGNTAIQPIVLSRYMIIFTPFLLYFFYTGLQWPIDKLIKKGDWGKLIGVLALATVLSSSFTGNAYTIQSAHAGSLYSPSEAAFIECAQWAKKNLPHDAVVGSRKERVFYVFSDGMKGFKHYANADDKLLKEGMTQSEYDNYKLNQIAGFNTRYMIIDTFSGSSTQMILPLMERYPDKFKFMHSFGDPNKGPCFLFEVIAWWKTNN